MAKRPKDAHGTLALQPGRGGPSSWVAVQCVCASRLRLKEAGGRLCDACSPWMLCRCWGHEACEDVHVSPACRLLHEIMALVDTMHATQSSEMEWLHLSELPQQLPCSRAAGSPPECCVRDSESLQLGTLDLLSASRLSRRP